MHVQRNKSNKVINRMKGRKRTTRVCRLNSRIREASEWWDEEGRERDTRETRTEGHR